VPEGTPLFAGEPMLTLRAPIVEAQIPETYLLSALSFQSLVASKAARACVGRPEAVGRRIRHAPRPHPRGRRAGRARRLPGRLRGTSNTLAGFRYGDSRDGHGGALLGDVVLRRERSLPQLQRVLGESAVQLIDTYDTIKGARPRAWGPFWGVRIDSGDFLALSRQVRAILDEAGLPKPRSW
jgi:nicotinate phosphoribosyltransferase